MAIVILFGNTRTEGRAAKSPAPQFRTEPWQAVGRLNFHGHPGQKRFAAPKP